jgi:hypothetical protein
MLITGFVRVILGICAIDIGIIDINEEKE